MKKIQLFCSAVGISDRYKFLKLSAIVSVFNSHAMQRATVNCAFLRRIHYEAKECYHLFTESFACIQIYKYFVYA